MNSSDKKNFVLKNRDTLEKLNSDEILDFVCQNVRDKKLFSTSFGSEDQVLTHKIASFKRDIEIFTLDTGRHFSETYQVHALTLDKYKIQIKAYVPDHSDIEKLLSEKGPESFFLSIENRKECCYLRKVKPLERALRGQNLWVTGIRRQQSSDRLQLPVIEYDEDHDIIKVHPLINWSDSELWNYIRENNIPTNALHKKGFLSIGCAPCTRAVSDGEDFRAGRWWWEESTHKECGLHLHRANK